MVLVHIWYYSDYGNFQKILGFMEMLIDLSLNNAPHIVVQWIERWWVWRTKVKGYVVKLTILGLIAL